MSLGVWPSGWYVGSVAVRWQFWTLYLSFNLPVIIIIKNKKEESGGECQKQLYACMNWHVPVLILMNYLPGLELLQSGEKGDKSLGWGWQWRVIITVLLAYRLQYYLILYIVVTKLALNVPLMFVNIDCCRFTVVSLQSDYFYQWQHPKSSRKSDSYKKETENHVRQCHQNCWISHGVLLNLKYE